MRSHHTGLPLLTQLFSEKEKTNTFDLHNPHTPGEKNNNKFGTVFYIFGESINNIFREINYFKKLSSNS